MTDEPQRVMIATFAAVLLLSFTKTIALADGNDSSASYSSMLIGSNSNEYGKILLNLINNISLVSTLDRAPHLVGLPRSVSGQQKPFRKYHNFRNGYNQNNRVGCRTNYDFDHIQLTLQWGPGACATSPRHCLQIVSQFTIHGLWLQSKAGEGPEFCCFDNSFDYQSLAPILPSLEKHWFSYFSSDNRQFWSHEWLKHGTCARDVPQLRGELRYFNTTVELVKHLPILKALEMANIVPNENKTYTFSQISDTLKLLTKGKEIQVNCDYEHKQPVPVLTGVNLCFDRQLNFADCPPAKEKCRKLLLFIDQ